MLMPTVVVLLIHVNTGCGYLWRLAGRPLFDVLDLFLANRPV
jgi:hypothetical protein